MIKIGASAKIEEISKKEKDKSKTPKIKEDGKDKYGKDKLKICFARSASAVSDWKFLDSLSKNRYI